jgi:transcriptional regulator with XRE-family HTH domain
MEGTMTSRCGRRSGYHDHLRAGTPTCEACRRAHREAHARWKKRSYLEGVLVLDATGTRRRLQALAAIGWSYPELAARCHVARSTLAKWTTRATVYTATARTVADLYEQLHDTPGSSVKSSRRAAAAGWPPPIAWDDDTIDDPTAVPFAGEAVDIDEVVVQRALAGRPVTLSRPERVEAVRRLTAAGRSAADIAAVLGVDDRTVQRDRSAA